MIRLEKLLIRFRHKLFPMKRLKHTNKIVFSILCSRADLAYYVNTSSISRMGGMQLSKIETDAENETENENEASQNPWKRKLNRNLLQRVTTALPC